MLASPVVEGRGIIWGLYMHLILLYYMYFITVSDSLIMSLFAPP